MLIHFLANVPSNGAHRDGPRLTRTFYINRPSDITVARPPQRDEPYETNPTAIGRTYFLRCRILARMRRFFPSDFSPTFSSSLCTHRASSTITVVQFTKSRIGQYSKVDPTRKSRFRVISAPIWLRSGPMGPLGPAHRAGNITHSPRGRSRQSTAMSSDHRAYARNSGNLPCEPAEQCPSFPCRSKSPPEC